MTCSWQYGLAILVQALLFIQVYSTTHWVVTEDGKIQAQMDSLFQLRRPYDFLALAQQEQRAVQVEELKQQLLRHKAHIDMHEDKDVHLEERIYRTDPDCLLAGKALTEFDLTASTSVSLSDYPELKVEERLLPARDESGDLLEPDCEAAYDMPAFSMAAFDHLLGVQERRNLSGDPELSLTMMGVQRTLEDTEDPDVTSLGSDAYVGSSDHLYADLEIEGSDEDEEEEEEDASVWGDRVARTLLTKDKSNWLIFSLATQYWRLRGEPLLAAECVRRALYLVPRTYRHIPLVQLGNLLHRSKLAHDAAVVLHSALDHHSTLYPAHLTLAHVYATMALYNVSAVCYSNAALLQPSSALPRKLKHAVLCHAHLEEALQQQHMSLQRTLSELQQYQQSHEEWLALHQKLLLEQATPEMKLESRLEYEEQKIRESSDGRGQDCFQYQQDGHTFLSCNMRRDQLEHRPQAADLLLDLTTLLHSVQGETMRLSNLRHQPAQSSVQPVFRLQPHHLGGGWVVGRSGSPGNGDAGSLPSDAAVCEEPSELPPWDSFPEVIVLPGVKGFNVKRLLTEDIGENLEEPLPLPRHLPICDRLPSALPPMLERIRSADVSVERCSRAATYLSKLGYEGDLQEAGHRVALALQKKAAPRWVLYNLAALYWRAVGNLWNGVECFRGVLGEEGAVLGENHLIYPPESEDYSEVWRKYDTLFVDVALGNLASLLYAVGRVDDALALAQRAVQVADYVSETQFLLANLLSVKGNVTGALYHYEKVLSLAPDHPHARDYHTALACQARNTSPQPPSSASSQEGHKLWAADEESEQPSSSSELLSGDADQPEEMELLSIKAFCEKGIDCSADTDTDSGSYLLEGDGDEDVTTEQTEELLEESRSKSFLSSALLPSLPPDSSTSTAPHSLPKEADPSSFDAHVEIEDLPTADWLLRNKEAPDWLLRNAEASVSGAMAKEGDFCDGYKKTVALRHFTSTWLSVSAKYIDISTYLPEAPVPLPPHSPSPVCPSVPASLPSLDHLSGVRHRHKLPHLPEAGLLEALHTLVDPPQSMEQLGHRLHAALQQNSLSSPGGWVVCTGAALYWRVEGNAENAIDCLRAALLYAPRDMRDVPLTSLANVLHRSGLYNNALIAANAALEISPKFVVIHFTLANILAAMGEYQKAATFYESTLALQSTFEPAKERLLAIYCEEHLDD